MKIILTQDVPKVGRKYEVKTVKPGFGQNFLIKKKLAIVANSNNIASVASRKAKHDALIKAQEEALAKSIEGLEAVEVKLKGKANEKGHLFAGFDAQDISEALKEQAGLELEASHIVLDKHLKEVGEYEVKVKVGDREAKVKVIVEREE